MNVLVKIGLTAILIIMALPGLVIEPGPLSEITAAVMIGSVWGVDLEDAA